MRLFNQNFFYEVLFLILVCLFVVPNITSAATRTWDGGGTDVDCGGGAGDGNKWSCAANWSSDTAPTSSDLASFDNTSTKDATIDSSFTGSVAGLSIAATYSGTITQARTLTIGTTGYSQAGGTFTGASQTIDLNGSFSLTGGVFTSTSGTFSVNNGFSVSGSPTFNANGGTVLFDTGAGSNPSISCNNITFNAVTITASLTFASFTIGSSCSLPLGNSATAQGLITNNGTITAGTGTFTITGSYTQNSGATLTMGGTTLDMNGSLTLSGGVFPAGLTTLNLMGSLTNTADLLPNGIALTIDSTAGSSSTLSCGTVTWGSVAISQSQSSTALTIGSTCVLPLGNSPTSSSVSITNNGTINVGTGTWTVNASYTQNSGAVLTMGGTALDMNGSLTLSGGTFPQTITTLNLTGSLTNTANLLPNGIALTIDSQAGSSTTLSCGTVTWASVAISQGLSSTGLTIGSTCVLPLGNSPTSSSLGITNNGTINVGTGTWTINSSLTMNTGSVFTMTGTTMDISGSLTLNGGTFEQGITTISVQSSMNNTGNMLPDGIAFTFDGVTEDTTLTCGTATLGSVTVNKTNANGELFLGDDCTITGNFTRTLGTIPNPGSAKVLYVGGNFSMASTNTLGGTNLTFEFNGSSDKTITQSAGTFSSKLKVNKSVGSSLTQATALVLGGTLEVASGTFDQGATFNLTTGGATTIGSSGTWSNTGTGDISLAGDVGNSGTITLDGSGVGCGDSDAIAISSSASPTQRTWSGSGTTNITDVAASDQAGTITARSSTDTSNNDWTFIACNSNPDTVGSLGPASYVDGSEGNDNTPTITFAITDSDVSDTVKYRIQIDDSSDFSSPVVDYTSALAAQGSTSFTVGQAVGSGTYTVGSNGQTLSDNSYYWRVKAIDNSDAESSYATANSGAIAFQIDTVVSSGGSSSPSPSNGPIVGSLPSSNPPILIIPPSTQTSTPIVYNPILSIPLTLPVTQPVSNNPPSPIFTATSKSDKCVITPNNSSLIPATIIFKKNISHNKVDEDVRALQVFLNKNGFIVAESGPGSIGHETSIYGDNTRDALMRFQIRYAEEIGNNGKSGNLVTPTRNFINSLYPLNKETCEFPIVINPAINDLPDGEVTDVIVQQVPPVKETIPPSLPTVSTTTNNSTGTQQGGSSNSVVSTSTGSNSNNSSTNNTSNSTSTNPVSSGTNNSSNNTGTIVITGWAVDPDVQDLPIIVTAQIREVEGDGRVIIATTSANISNSVVNIESGYDGDHGFELHIPIPQNLSSFNTYVYATDSENKSVNVLLPGSNFPPSNFPIELVIDQDKSLFKVEVIPSGNSLQNIPSTSTAPIVKKSNSKGIYNYLANIVSSIISNTKDFAKNSKVKIFEKVAVTVPALISLLLLLTPLFSGTSFSNYIFYLGIIVLQFFGVRKESKPWGTVYSSLTKKPISYARVEILDSQSRKLESSISDSNGRYGFLASERISANDQVEFEAYQKNYAFPSVTEISSVEKILYPNIYRGGFITITEGLVNFDLPMDPTDDNQIKNYFNIVSVKLNALLVYCVNTLFIGGLIVGLISVIFDPNPINFLLIFIVLITYILRRSGIKLKPFGLTIDSYTKQIMPFSFVALHDETGRRVNFTVSDEKGRYFLLSKKGSYFIKAYTPSQIEPARQTDTLIKTKKGWISVEIDI